MSGLVRFEQTSGREVWVNPAHVVHVEAAADGMCWIGVVSCRSFLVSESAHAAARRISDVQVYR